MKEASGVLMGIIGIASNEFSSLIEDLFLPDLDRMLLPIGKGSCIIKTNTKEQKLASYHMVVLNCIFVDKKKKTDKAYSYTMKNLPSHNILLIFSFFIQYEKKIGCIYKRVIA